MARAWETLNEAFKTGHVCADNTEALQETVQGRAGIFHMRSPDKVPADVLVGILNKGAATARFTLHIPPVDPISESVKPGDMRPLRLPLVCLHHNPYWTLDCDSPDDLVYVFGQVPHSCRQTLALGAWETAGLYIARGWASKAPRQDVECLALPPWGQ